MITIYAFIVTVGLNSNTYAVRTVITDHRARRTEVTTTKPMSKTAASRLVAKLLKEHK